MPGMASVFRLNEGTVEQNMLKAIVINQRNSRISYNFFQMIFL